MNKAPINLYKTNVKIHHHESLSNIYEYLI